MSNHKNKDSKASDSPKSARKLWSGRNSSGSVSSDEDSNPDEVVKDNSQAETPFSQTDTSSSRAESSSCTGSSMDASQPSGTDSSEQCACSGSSATDTDESDNKSSECGESEGDAEAEADNDAESADNARGGQDSAKSELSEEEKLNQLAIKLTEERNLLNDKYIRLMADFDNYRRNAAKERLALIDTASKDVIEGFLPVLDDCQRAIQMLSQSDASDAAKEGTELIYTKLIGYLKSKGLAQMDVVGKDFDTDFHEAVAQFPAPSPDKKNKIMDVVQQGYTLKGKVIRFAKVVVWN